MVAHEGTCNYREMKCQLCAQMVAFKDMNHHRKFCNNQADVPCLHCELAVKPTLMDLHLHDCQSLTVQCKGYRNCGVFLPRREMGRHEELCEYVQTECPECEESFPRKDIKNHNCIEVLKKLLNRLLPTYQAMQTEIDQIKERSQKQQHILDVLNRINNEKLKKAQELDKALGISKNGKPAKKAKDAKKEPEKVLKDEKQKTLEFKPSPPPLSVKKKKKGEKKRDEKLADKQQEASKCACKKKRKETVLVGECYKCQKSLCSHCKFFCIACKVYICPGCKTQCDKCFNFVCQHCSCGCKK